MYKPAHPSLDLCKISSREPLAVLPKLSVTPCLKLTSIHQSNDELKGSLPNSDSAITLSETIFNNFA